MSSTCAAVGGFSQFAVQGGSTPRTFGSGSEKYQILYENIGSERVLQGRSGITGTRSRWAGKVREHSYLVKGTIAMQCSPNDLTAWLPRIFGGPYAAGTPGTVALADVLPDFDILVDRENGVFRYKNCQVAQAIIRGASSQGGEQEDLIELIMMVIGTEELTGQTWPSPGPSLSTLPVNLPYGFWEGDLTVDSVVLPYDQFSLAVNNHLMVRFRNSLTPSCIRPTDRSVNLSVEMPFTSASHAEALGANTSPVTGSLVFTHTATTSVTEFQFPALRNIYTTPAIQGRGEIPLRMALEAFRTATDTEVVIEHTP